MFRARLVAVLALALWAAPAVANPRSWTDTSGKFHAEAELADYQNGQVYLKEADGRIVPVAVGRLSSEDREFIKAHVPAAQLITGKVVSITDGDTLTVLDKEENQYKVRLEGIDAPESHQAYGTLARKALASKTFEKNVTIESHGRDKYGRTLGHVFVDSHWINKELVKEGWAWHYREYSKSEVLSDAESEARTDHAGLWKDANPIAPWDFRHPPPATSRTQIPADSAKEPASKDEAKQIVYVTKTGTKYHQDGCRSLSKSRISIPLDEAASRYSPCSICHPPITTKSGESATAIGSKDGRAVDRNKTFASFDEQATAARESPTAADRDPNNETVTGHTVTGIPTYTGPRGGQYHYSKSGKKVYERKRK